MNSQNQDMSYLDWLMSLVDVYQNDPEYDVGETLSTITYIWKYSLDKNFAIGGLYLRGEYQDIYGIADEDLRQDECSVLEVLIVLARSFSKLTTDVSVADAYWEMTYNLGITPEKLGQNDSEHVRHIVNQWITHNQDERALPGPLPLFHYSKDASALPLTYLLNDYISENHPHDPNWLNN